LPPDRGESLPWRRQNLTLALAVLWWLARYEHGIVLTTSPTFRQVRTQLWTEIHRAVAHSKFGFGELKTTELKLRGDHNLALGLSTNRAENFQGYHGRQVLIIADEAPGIESGIWDAVVGTMAGGKVHLVMAGNPTIPSGAFFDAFGRERNQWNCITIDAFDSPNLAGLTLQQLLDTDPAPGGPLDHNPVPYLVTKRWVRDQYHTWWHGDDRSSPSWVSRVRGQFPDQASNSLFKLLWLERARARALSAATHNNLRLVAGVDVGGGQAETVVHLCEVAHGINRIINLGAWRGEDTRGQVVAFLAPYRDRLTLVRVDSIGIGHNFALHLRDQGFKVELVNVSQTCERIPRRLNWLCHNSMLFACEAGAKQVSVELVKELQADHPEFLLCAEPCVGPTNRDPSFSRMPPIEASLSVFTRAKAAWLAAMQNVGSFIDGFPVRIVRALNPLHFAAGNSRIRQAFVILNSQYRPKLLSFPAFAACVRNFASACRPTHLRKWA
jgi:hypothetical protein